jgi:calcineurin-like phosphoesterase
MRILFVGDVVGRSGRTVVHERLPGLIRDWQLDFVAVNGENAAGGFGITEAIYRGAALCETKAGARVLVVNAMGRIFMDPLDDPFAAIDRELSACPLRHGADAIVIDIHAETTSEKQATGYFCDGRASLVVGTHTHVPTADLRILPGGTAFITDVGMTGDYDSVIGMAKEEPLQRFTRRITSARFEPASGAATLCAVAVEVDPATGLAARVAPVRLGGGLEPATPAFWC